MGELTHRVGLRVSEVTKELSSANIDTVAWSEQALSVARGLVLEVAVINGIYELDVDYWNGSQGSGKSTLTRGLSVFASEKSTRRLPDTLRRKIRMYRQKPIVMGTGGVMSSPHDEYKELTSPIAEASKRMVQNGELAPDSFAVAAAALMTAYRLAEYGNSPDGYAGVVFDGFPRNVEQRRLWHEEIESVLPDNVVHKELMLVPLPKGFNESELSTPGAVEAAKVFASVILETQRLNVIGDLENMDLNGSGEICRVLALGLSDIGNRLSRQSTDQARVDATTSALARRLGGFYSHTSELWPGSIIINSNQSPAKVSADVMNVFGFHRNGDPRVRKVVNGIAAETANLVRS